jgi:hypothetical protein
MHYTEIHNNFKASFFCDGLLHSVIVLYQTYRIYSPNFNNDIMNDERRTDTQWCIFLTHHNLNAVATDIIYPKRTKKQIVMVYLPHSPYSELPPPRYLRNSNTHLKQAKTHQNTKQDLRRLKNKPNLRRHYETTDHYVKSNEVLLTT